MVILIARMTTKVRVGRVDSPYNYGFSFIREVEFRLVRR